MEQTKGQLRALDILTRLEAGETRGDIARSYSVSESSIYFSAKQMANEQEEAGAAFGKSGLFGPSLDLEIIAQGEANEKDESDKGYHAGRVSTLRLKRDGSHRPRLASVAFGKSSVRATKITHVIPRVSQHVQ